MRVWLELMLVLLCLMLLNTYARAELIDLRELAIDYRNFAAINANGRDAVTYPDPPKESLALEIKTDVLNYFYWDSRVHGTTTDSQYKAVGLNTRLGLRITDAIEFGLQHHSQHVLDGSHPYMDKFPVEDSLQLKIYLFKSPKREAVF